MLDFEELRADVESGAIDTVVVAFTDMQGRLLGKRLHGEFFVDEIGAAIRSRAATTCSRSRWRWTVPYAIASWERGYGDFAMVPDLATLRRIRGSRRRRSSSATCSGDGSPVAPSPRQVLRAQMGGPRRSATPMFGSELEFFLLKETYAEARATRPDAVGPYILDYHILATTYDEPFIRTIRNGMQAAGMRVETSKGEAWPGQHEINFRYADALTMADNHVVYKNGAKELAHQHGCSITFMAKPDHSWIGSSCHIHTSLWRGDQARGPGSRAPARRSDRERAGAGDLPRAERQLVQALRGGLVGADDARLGRDNHVRLPHRRSRSLAPDGDAHPGRTRTRTSPSRRSSRPGSTGSSGDCRYRTRSRATPTSPTPIASRTRCARRSRRSEAGESRVPRSATRSSTTTSTMRAPSRSSSIAW